VQSHDRSVEVFRIRTEEEARKKQLRRRKRAKEKNTKGKEGQEEATTIEEDTPETNIEIVDLFTPHLVVRASGKIRSFDMPSTDTSKNGFSVSE
jgi:U3 small nucleolar RNA-associated protein 12